MHHQRRDLAGRRSCLKRRDLSTAGPVRTRSTIGRLFGRGDVPRGRGGQGGRILLLPTLRLGVADAEKRAESEKRMTFHGKKAKNRSVQLSFAFRSSGAFRMRLEF